MQAILNSTKMLAISWTEGVNFLLVIAGSILTCYAFAAMCFLFHRFVRRETAERQRHFLGKLYFFFTFRPFSQAKTEVTQQTIREAGRRVWGLVAMACVSLNHGMTSYNLIASIGILYFGGLTLSYAWYGQRCLRMLGLETFKKETV
jgi:hypothetical protein